MKSNILLAIVIPYYNEEGNLPILINSIRTQLSRNVHWVFVDNNSNDDSTSILRNTPEIKSGRWSLLYETKKGKVNAVKTGVNHVYTQIGAPWLGCLDADIVFDNQYWIENLFKIINKIDIDTTGYIHGKLSYYFEQEAQYKYPAFIGAHRVYDTVINDNIMPEIDWFATYPNCVVPTDLYYSVINKSLEEYQTDKVFGIPEHDLRVTLELLKLGKKPVFNSDKIWYSGRRLICDFRSWYGDYRNFRYGNKRNADGTTYYMTSNQFDLEPGEVESMFIGRAKKLVERNLNYMIAFDKFGSIRQRVEKYFDLDLRSFSKIFSKSEKEIEEVVWDCSPEGKHEAYGKYLSLRPESSLMIACIASEMSHLFNKKKH